MRILLVLLFGVLLAGGGASSCKHYATEPQDSVKCDTCGTDTTTHPCDTCGINRDSLSHAFEWTEYTIPGETNLTGVWVFSDTDIRIVGNSFWKFNGTGFQEVPAYNLTFHKPMNGAMNGLSLFGFNKDDYWMVYASVAFFTTWDGNFYDYRFGAVNACWGTSSNDMFFVGNGGHIHHYNGVKFDTMISPTTKNLRSVWGTSHNNVWAGGLNRQNGQSVLLHYNGTTWENIELSTIGKFECANCDGISSVWAFDSSNRQLGYVGGSHFYRTNGNGQWTNDSDRVGNKFSDGSYAGISSIRGNDASDIFCCSDWGFASHWNGKTWLRYDILYDPQNFNYGTNAMDFHGNTICLVGFKGGQSWVAVGRRK